MVVWLGGGGAKRPLTMTEACSKLSFVSTLKKQIYKSSARDQLLGESLRREVGCMCELLVQKRLSVQLAVRVWKVIESLEVVNDRVLLWRFFTAVFGEEPVTERGKEYLPYEATAI